MLISDLKNQIVNKKLDNFYMFTGEEEGIMGIYIDQMCKLSGLNRKRVDTLDEVLKEVGMKSLIGGRTLYIIREDNAIIKQETAWPNLEKLAKNNILVFVYPSVDKKTKFYKFFESRLITFEKLADDVLRKFVSKQISLQDNFANQLIKYCGNSYSLTMNEVDKIKCLAAYDKQDADFSFLQLDRENCIYKEHVFDIFEYIKTIMSRDAKGCFEGVKYVKEQKMELLLVSLLYTQFRNLMVFLNDPGGKGVCERTGLTPWYARCCIESLGHYDEYECEDIAQFLQKCEMGLKTGKVDPEYAVEYMLVNIL